MKVPISNALRETVSQARYDISERPAGSVLNNALLVDLIALWERYDSLLLTNLPISDIDAQKLKWSPMKWSKFEKKQIDHMTYIKNILVNEWYPKAQQILLDAAEEGIFDNTPIEVLTHFFEACASLLSRQVRFKIIFFLLAFFFYFFFLPQRPNFLKHNLIIFFFFASHFLFSLFSFSHISFSLCVLFFDCSFRSSFFHSIPFSFVSFVLFN